MIGTSGLCFYARTQSSGHRQNKDSVGKSSCDPQQKQMRTPSGARKHPQAVQPRHGRTPPLRSKRTTLHTTSHWHGVASLPRRVLLCNNCTWLGLVHGVNTDTVASHMGEQDECLSTSSAIATTAPTTPAPNKRLADKTFDAANTTFAAPAALATAATPQQLAPGTEPQPQLRTAPNNRPLREFAGWKEVCDVNTGRAY